MRTGGYGDERPTPRSARVDVAWISRSLAGAVAPQSSRLGGSEEPSGGTAARLVRDSSVCPLFFSRPAPHTQMIRVSARPGKRAERRYCDSP
jgi:hypothetical protein